MFSTIIDRIDFDHQRKSKGRQNKNEEKPTKLAKISTLALSPGRLHSFENHLNILVFFCRRNSLGIFFHRRRQNIGTGTYP